MNSMSSVVQDKIFASASRLFTEQGYQHVSLRQIAEDAGVAASLIIRHFESKEKLFLKVISLRTKKTKFIKSPKEQIGETIVTSVLASIEDPTSTIRSIGALMEADDSVQIKDELSKITKDILLQPLIELLDGEQKELRASLITAQITGLLVQMYKIKNPVLLASKRQDIVHYYGHAIQALVNIT